MKYSLSIICILTFLLTTGWAQDEKEQKEKSAENKEEKSPPPEEKSVTKEAKVTIDGKEITYEVTAATISLPQKDKPDKERARVFHVSYVAKADEDNSGRPIAFCFNGGPGSSSVWLHLGMLGPRRVQLDEAGKGIELAPPPYGVVENEYSILDIADLVFIDPVSTGFSRPADQEKKKEFHSFEGDIESVGRFIHQYCSEHGRWDSPKYLIGESYGGLRAAALADHLQDRYGMYLNGIVLVSALLDFRTILFSEANDLPHLLFLPSYAATAQYHGKTDFESPAAAHAAAVEFVSTTYDDALHAGSALPDEDRQAAIDGLAELTGLEKEEIDRTNLRIDSSYFRKMLMQESGNSVGRFDSRVPGLEPDKASSYPAYDPSYAVVYGPFASALNAYLREDIGFESDDVYEILTREVHPWNYEQFTNRYVSVGKSLSSAMTSNPHLKVFVAAGYYDLATPPAAIDYSIRHLPIDPTLHDNFQTEYYDGGHMMYTNLTALQKMKEDLAEFLTGE